ncbi:MAG: efflux RND transporter periplasmic adaptor subunit [Burkholderiales bacterium]|nr:efflux RND transporter periplasmic adaptor subunit [Burkholderiales bacterium]
MKQAFLTLLIALAVGAGAFWIGQRQAPSPASPPAIAPATAQTAYVCPMHSHIVQDHPGACPICGMDLVAANQASDAGNQIYVDTATQHKLGVRIASAEKTALTRDIQTYATLVADEGALLRITPNIDGVLTKLHVSRVGQRVARGQVLYELSSQDALALQYEYIDITRRGVPTRKMVDEQRAQNRKALAEAQDAASREQAEQAARQSEEQLRSILQPLERDRERIALRLQQIGLNDAMLAKLLETRKALTVVPVRAPQACVVKEIMARPGMAVNHMTEILSCVDASRAWLEVVLYPDQLSWVREGDAVTVEFETGAPIKTRLTGLNPLVDNATRTVRARLPITASANLGEYANVTIHAAPHQVLSVPKSAVMRSGRGNFVMRALDKGHFMPVAVTTGIESTERIAILDGLQEGDQVVVNGQFLLDAAASIADAAQRLKGQASQDKK